jgi:hypothetical protein
MILEIPTALYDEKLHGKPYIAKMTFDDPTGTPEWGTFVGLPGEAGLLVLPDVYSGDVVMTGQKSKKTGYTAPSFFILLEKGELLDVSKVNAYKHYKARLAHRAERKAGGWGEEL